MSKLHYCSNGKSVTEQVLIYLSTKANSDYIPIQQYYSDFKTHWYKQLEDYMDRATFDSEFDYRLCQAVLKFKARTAKRLATKHKWSAIGMFNRWFYRCLIHWCLNVKTSAVRMKKKPPVQCPVCGRMIPKITEEHLYHFKSIKDLPFVFVWKGRIYETVLSPAKYAVCWGDTDAKKLDDLNNGLYRIYKKERRQVLWPWKAKDGSKRVMCPFTKKLIHKIDIDYIKTLDDKYSRYAESMSWTEFVEKHPMVLIQAEIYSLDYDNSKSDNITLKDAVSAKAVVDEMDHDAIKAGRISPKYEHAFKIIDDCVQDSTDRDILKLTAIGYTTDDIAETLQIDKKNIKKSLMSARSLPIKSKLLD